MMKRIVNGWTTTLFILALLPRAINLGQFLTSDERTNIFIAGSAVVQAFLRGDFRRTYWHFYPGVTMSWADGLGMGLQWLWERFTGATALPLTQFVDSDIRHIMVATRLPYAVLTALFVPAVYLLLRRWLDPRRSDPTAHAIAVAAALVVAFDPFFLAHSRVVHGDAPVSVFMTLSVLALYLYWRDDGWKMLVFSAAMGGLAALTKAPGEFMAPFVLLGALLAWGWDCRQTRRVDWSAARRRLLDMVIWGTVALAVFVVLWPSMWVAPIGTVQEMLAETFGKVDEGHLVYFLGQPTKDPGVWFYLTVIPFRLTPLTSIGVLLSLGVLLYQTITLKKAEPDSPLLRTSYPLLLLLWLYAITLLLFGNLSPKKQDRYLLPLFPVLDVLAVLGWAGLVSGFRFRVLGSKRTVQNLIMLGLVVGQAAIALPWHPYYLSYFNQLLGGLPRAVNTTLVGWGEGMEQAAAYLNQKPNAADLYVASTPAQTFLPYFKGRGENFYTNDVALRADYVIIYRAQQQRLAPSPEIVREYMRRTPEKVITIKGVPYAWIYRNTPLIFGAVPDWGVLTNIGFGDVMRLAGYHVEQTDGVLVVDLFWHALPPIENDRGACYETVVEDVRTTICPRKNYAVSVRLVSSAGAVIAQHDGWPADGLLPTSQWRVNDYVQDQHALTLPADLPPDAYILTVVVYDADTQAVLAGPVTVDTLQLSVVTGK